MATQESERQRVNRELLELLGELRVALPGVQVLFAFLLAVPFQARFAEVTTFQRDIYFATLVLSALASVLLIAPSALHRLNFRTPDKRRIVFLSNTLTVWGLLVLALAMTGVMLLIGDVLFGRVAGVLIASASAAVFALFWWLLPVAERRRSGPDYGRGPRETPDDRSPEPA
jgi:Family of unknown function (DUF6328)